MSASKPAGAILLEVLSASCGLVQLQRPSWIPNQRSMGEKTAQGGSNWVDINIIAPHFKDRAGGARILIKVGSSNLQSKIVLFRFEG